MLYIKDGLVSHIARIRADNPNVSIPDTADLAHLGYAKFAESAQPACDHINENCVPAEPVVLNGIVTQQWQVVPASTEQVAQRQASAVAAARDAAKQARSAAVDEIKVTTAAGNVFDGDETSQGRMARAIVALSTGVATSVVWVLADNTTIQASAAELTEALVLAGQAQAAIWVI